MERENRFAFKEKHAKARTKLFRHAHSWWMMESRNREHRTSIEGGWRRKRRARGGEHFFMLLKVTKDYLRLPEFDFLAKGGAHGVTRPTILPMVIRFHWFNRQFSVQHRRRKPCEYAAPMEL
jgi:hypothetical protein